MNHEFQATLQQYAEKHSISYQRSTQEVYHYTNTNHGGRIRNPDVLLTIDHSCSPARLLIVIILPVRITRGEAYHIYKELAIINTDLENNQSCYEIDAITGAIQFRTIVEAPHDCNSLEQHIEECLCNVEEDYITILQVVLKAINTPE